MRKRYISPYGKIGKVKYPLLNINIGQEKWSKNIMVLIDSGATISVFNRRFGEDIGLKIEKGEPNTLQGVGGGIKTYMHKIKFEVAGKKFMGRACFAEDYKWDINILGRMDVFNKFYITFIEEKEVIIFEYED